MLAREILEVLRLSAIYKVHHNLLCSGPLVTRETGGYYTVIGVVSWGSGCANVN